MPETVPEFKNRKHEFAFGGSAFLQPGFERQSLDLGAVGGRVG
jgi:hypothetical protein